MVTASTFDAIAVGRGTYSAQ